MNTSILGDKIIVLWQVLLAGGAVAFSVTFGVWLMGRKWRKKGEQPPSLARRVAVCATVATAAFLSIPAAVGAQFSADADEGVYFPVFLAGMAIVIGCIVVAVQIVRGWNKSVMDQVLLIVFLCIISISICGSRTLNRLMGVLPMRASDGAYLSGIGNGLILHHEEYGAYPDDLRRLVDDGQPADLLLSRRGTSKDKIPDPRPVPYDGPCDFVYIRLPADAPDNLVWVWQPVKYHDNEGGNVLFKGGNVRWLTPEKLKAEVARTHKWLETHPTTQPATAPAG